MRIRGPLAAEVTDELYGRVGALLGAGHAALTCEVAGAADLSVVNALARVQLMCRRRGVRLRIDVDRSCDDLAALLGYLGLAGYLGNGPATPDGA